MVENVILQGIVGSKAYGLDHPDSDIDRLGVFLAPARYFLGLERIKETVNFKIEDGDVTVHEIGKFCKLALDANPTILELLFLPEYTITSPLGEELRSRRLQFLSNRVRQTYHGYAKGQLHRLLTRGDGSFSADTRRRRPKHARHLARLLIQGRQLLQTGEITVRLTPTEVDHVREISTLGDVELQHAFNDLACDLDCVKSVLPDEPNREGINQFLISARLKEIYRDA